MTETKLLTRAELAIAKLKIIKGFFKDMSETIALPYDTYTEALDEVIEFIEDKG